MHLWGKMQQEASRAVSIRASQMTGSDAWAWDSVLACFLQHLGLHSVPGSSRVQMALEGGLSAVWCVCGSFSSHSLSDCFSFGV